MYNLPIDIILYIYEFDDTCKLNYDQCIKEYKKYFKNYDRKTLVYQTEVISDPNNLSNYVYSKMSLRYEYIPEHLTGSFQKYILFYLTAK